jgi:hypothetical protein
MKSQETGRIMIYQNRQKLNGDKTPEYSGGWLLDGKIYDIGLCMYQSKSGMIYMSGSVVEIPEVLEYKKPVANDSTFSGEVN